MTNAMQSPTRPVTVNDPTRTPRLIIKIGGALSGLGLILMVTISALMPSGETGQYEVAVGAAFGDQKSQALVLGAELSAVAFALGLLVLIVGVVWRLCVRKQQPSGVR